MSREQGPRVAAGLLRWLALLLLLGHIGAAAAAEVLLLHAGEERRALAGSVSVLADPSGTKSIAEVSALDPARFRVLERSFSAGYTRAAHWFRFTLRREAEAPPRWLLEIQPAYLDDLRLYEPDPASSGGFRERRAGDRLPFASRDEAHRAFVFNLGLPDEQPRTYFLRLQTTTTSVAQMTVWSPPAFARASRGEYLFWGVFYGALAMILAYGLIHWRQFRERFYVYFLFHVLTTLVAALANSGFAAQFLLPDAPVFVDFFARAGQSLVLIFSTLFFLAFLEVRRYGPRLFYVYVTVIGLAVLGLAAALAGYHPEMAPVTTLAALVIIPLSLYYAFRTMRLGLLGSRAVFWGYLWYCGVAVATLLAFLGVLPGDALILAGWQFGALGNIIFLQHGVLSRLGHAEREREAALERARRAEEVAFEERIRRRQQAQFLTTVAHELKTPLAVIDSAVQALGYQQGSEDAGAARRHERIRQAVARLNKLVEKALSRGRDDEAPMAPRLAPVAAEELMEDAAASAPGAAQRLEIESDPGQVCLADQALMRIALGNLIDNALKYAPPGTPIRLASLAQSRENRSGTLFTVENAVAGLPAEAAERLFEKHWRGPNSEGTEGAGLGLHTVRSIAQAHGGEAECRLAPGRARFSIWIPQQGVRSPS